MPCPTCDHTMHGIGNGQFWCPRCGTLRSNARHDVQGEEFHDSVPMLVDRCRVFYDEAVARKTERAADVWRRRGIAESINTPANRGK